MYDNEFGEIQVNTRANMCRVTARWRNNLLSVNKPAYVTLNQIATFINENREALRSLRQKSVEKAAQAVRYTIGQRIPCFRGDVLIAAIEYRPHFTGYKRDKDGNFFILISSKDDINTDIKQKAISGALKELMKRTAPHVLIPFAH